MDNSSEFFDVPSVDTPDGSPARELVSHSDEGYCEIWRFDRGGRFRILKCLKEEYREIPMYEQLLRKEFEIGYSLSHGNICEYYSFKKDPLLGSCIEMEWVDGRTLESFLSEGKHERSVYDKIAGEICSALSYMHAKQVLHRDLKPSNILVTFNGNNVKLIDFGLSDTDSSSMLKTPAGTLVYAAPEVLSGGKATVRSDLYSLGVVLSMFPVRKYSPVVRRLCSQKPEGRYASAAEVQKALKGNMLVVAGIIFLLLVIAMASFPVLEKRFLRTDIPAGHEVSAGYEVSAGHEVPAGHSDIVSGHSEHGEESLDPSSLPQDDSMAVKSDQPLPGVAKPRKPVSPARRDTTSSTSDTRLIDELFRQATELFE